MPMGCINPAMAPCPIRAAINNSGVGAKPPAREISVNMAMAALRVLRTPKRSSSHAEASMVVVMAAMKPVASQ